MDLLNLLIEKRGLTWSDYVEMNNPEHADLLDVDTLADELDIVYKSTFLFNLSYFLK